MSSLQAVILISKAFYCCFISPSLLYLGKPWKATKELCRKRPGVPIISEPSSSHEGVLAVKKADAAQDVDVKE